MYDAIIVGEYLCSYCSSRGVDVNHTKLQKLLYIVYGTYLVEENEALFDEEPLAWLSGPIFLSLHKHLSGRNPLTSDPMSAPRFDSIRVDRVVIKTFERVVSNFGGWSVQQLCDWCRRSGSAWRTALSDGESQYGAKISSREVFRSFSRIVDHRERGSVRVMAQSTPPVSQSENKRMESLYLGDNPDSFSLKQQQSFRYGEDTLLRGRLVVWMMWFIPLWMLLILLIVALCEIDNGVKIALLSTTTVNVLGLPLIILRGLFDKSGK